MIGSRWKQSKKKSFTPIQLEHETGSKNQKMMSSIGKTESLFPIRISLYNSGALLIKLLKEKMVFFNHGFSELPFSVSILDYVDYTDISYNDDNEVIKSIDHCYQSLDELIDRITKNQPIKEGTFEPLGVNVYDAKYYRGYIYTTNSLSYRDDRDIILYGNFLIQVNGNTIIKIYRD